MHQELIDHPPVKYINSEPQKPANFSDVSKIDILVPAAKAVLNFTKIPNFWYVRKKADLIHSSGYCILMDIFGNKIDFSNMPKGMKTPKLINLKRIGARKSWIMFQKIIQNI